MHHDSPGRSLRIATTLLAILAGCTNAPVGAPEALSALPRSVSSGDEGTWSATGRMGAGRLLHMATRLPDGRVLAMGGYNRSAELYDPTTGAWSRTADTLNTHRRATATLLQNGQVLVAGAGGPEWDSGISAALYDSATSTWTATGSLATPRFHHTATLLLDGRVLVVGGADGEYGGSVLASAELYDPTRGGWTPAGSMTMARRNHTATRLPDGKVLVIGGNDGGGTLQRSAEVYDPANGTWRPVANMAMARAYHSATLLPNGKVLVAGGGGSDWESSASVEVFDPSSDSWTASAGMTKPRRYHSATLLPTGLVLVAGGFHEYTGTLAEAEVYDASNASWRPAGAMTNRRYLHTATLLTNDRVLVAGGFSTGDQASSELYLPASSTPEVPTEPQGTSLLLQVIDTSGAPIPAAAVSSGGALFPTDSSGHLLFENLPAGRFLARVDALGFTSASAVLQLREGAKVGYQVTLHARTSAATFQAEQGGIIETESVRVTVPPGAVVDALGQPVSGTVEVTLNPIDPTTQLPLAPGPLKGASSHGEPVELESLFMAEVSLWHDGAPAQLAPEASATLEFILPDAVASRFQAGETIPAWWFDLDAGIWRKEGAGTLQASASHPGKLSWVTQVHHFTWWNCDNPWWEKNCVKVQVLDNDGQPVANVPVNAQGISYAGISDTVYTGPDGSAFTEIKRGGTAKVFGGSSTTPITGIAYITGPDEATSCVGGVYTTVLLSPPPRICTPGAFIPCPYSGPAGTRGQGLCRVGGKRCNTLGTQWSTCQGETVPQDETCELPFDEDCDGVINETCSCSASEGQSCYGGPPSTQGVGLCHEGIIRCDAFGNVVCQGQHAPVRERCSTPEDDDCDGSTTCVPLPEWARTLSDASAPSQKASRLAMDRWGNALMTGSFAGTLHLGDASLTGDANDFFVAKFSPTGLHVWSQLIQRESAETEQDFLAVDGEDHVLLAGSFTGSLQVGGQTLTSAGHSSIFVAKLSPDGALLWVQSFGGDAPAMAWAAGIATDGAGHVLVTGRFRGNFRIGTTEHSATGQAIYVMKLDGSTGQPLWSKRYQAAGNGGQGQSEAVAVDPSGNVLLAGSFSGTLDIDGALISNEGIYGDAFAVKLDGGTGGRLWSRRISNYDFNAGVYEYGKQVAADGAGNVLFLTWGSQTGVSQLMKLEPNGETLWSKRVDTQGFLMSHLSLTIDAQGNALIAGETMPQGLPGAFVAWYGADGQLRTERVFGGWSNNGQYAVAMGRAAATDPQGHVLFTGEYFGNVDFETGPMPVEGGIFLVKLDPTL
ncbi:kelch repeat-containing protein [Hyalangium rubrum]|uniref:Kelch repeat-containing protein n=1 Tax=Hyalangium rubrum TaxID=3103134 RepID=A0ABU5H7B5_9BACT|nr:kelch repeat-containing protein [Hyalangium sp. s54d21]MDY7229355.1 kelch repeat-containing protein [Hyalangium sp. s54d21]